MKWGNSSSSSMSLTAILIAIAFLNVPAYAAGLAGHSSPGSIMCGARAGTEATDSTTAGTVAGGRLDGPAPATITFPFGGGSDTSFRFQLPGNCLVLNASLRLDPASALPPAVESIFTLADTQHSDAYEGITKDSPPTGAPSTFQSQKFSAQDCSDVSTEDGNTHATITYGIGSPYHLFRFKVLEDSVTSLTVTWVGLGYDWVMDCTDTRLYIYNSGHWQSLGSHSADSIESDYVTLQKTIQPTNGYIDASGMVNILAMGPDGILFSVLESDYVELKAMGSNYVWPSDVEMDLGADGTAEMQQSGELRVQMTVGSDLLREPLQALLDSAVPRDGGVDVPVRFSSRTGGVLSVQGTVDVDLPPVFAPIPPDKASFDEDTEAPGLIDLDAYCRDDRDARPAYELFTLPESGKIEGNVDPDGHHLDFRSSVKDWYGTGEFSLRATDSQGLSAELFFNVTVLPVNDPPVLCAVADQTAYEDQPFTLIARAFDVDDPASNLTFSDDCPLFDINPSTGLISFTPTNGQVGNYTVNLTVQDVHGLADPAIFDLTVVNVNDPPVLSCADELKAVEHQSFEYQPSATDPDAGDVLTFSIDCDIEGPEADAATGAISFIPGEGDVGEHELVYTVTDLAGASDTRSVRLTVKNVNDPPIIGEGGELQAVQDQKFEYQLNASDPDAGDHLSFSIDSDMLRIDERSGMIRFTPGNADVGRHRFAVTVQDAGGLTAQAHYVLVVQNVNDPPEQVRISSPAVGADIREGELIQFTGSAVDPDIGDVLVFVWREGATVLGRGASLSISLPPGRHVVTLEASDGLLNATADVQLTVVKSDSQSGGISAALKTALVPAGITLLVAGIAVAAAVHRKRRRKGPAAGAPPLAPRYQPPPPMSSPPPMMPPQPAPPPPGTLPVQPQFTGGSQWMRQPSSGIGPMPPIGAMQPVPSMQGMDMYQPPPSSMPGESPSERYFPSDIYRSARYPLQPPPQPYAQAFVDPQSGQPLPRAGRSDPAVPYTAGGFAESPVTMHAPCPPGPPPPQGPPPACTVPDRSSAAYPQFPGPPAGPYDQERLHQGCGPNDGPSPHGGAPERPGSGASAEAAQERPPGVARGDEGAVSRDAMRAAINDAKHALSAARAAGLNPSECERLLSEAVAASYRMDYARAQRFARRSESVALSMLERAAAENGGRRRDGGDGAGGNEGRATSEEE